MAFTLEPERGPLEVSALAQFWAQSDHSPDGLQQLSWPKWLCQCCFGTKNLCHMQEIAKSTGHGDDFDSMPPVLEHFYRIEPVLLRHRQIREHQVDVSTFELVHGLFPVFSSQDFESGLPEDLAREAK